MPWFRVPVTAYVEVEADSKEEAKQDAVITVQKALDRADANFNHGYVFADDDVEVDDGDGNWESDDEDEEDDGE